MKIQNYIPTPQFVSQLGSYTAPVSKFLSRSLETVQHYTPKSLVGRVSLAAGGILGLYLIYTRVWGSGNESERTFGKGSKPGTEAASAPEDDPAHPRIEAYENFKKGRSDMGQQFLCFLETRQGPAAISINEDNLVHMTLHCERETVGQRSLPKAETAAFTAYKGLWLGPENPLENPDLVPYIRSAGEDFNKEVQVVDFEEILSVVAYKQGWHCLPTSLQTVWVALQLRCSERAAGQEVVVAMRRSESDKKPVLEISTRVVEDEQGNKWPSLKKDDVEVLQFDAAFYAERPGVSAVIEYFGLPTK